MNQMNENNQGEDLSDVFEGPGNDTKSEEKQHHPARSSYHGTPKIIRWVIKYSGGLVKDEKQANYVLLVFVAVMVVVSLFLVFGGGSEVERNINPETGEEVIPGQIPGEI